MRIIDYYERGLIKEEINEGNLPVSKILEREPVGETDKNWNMIHTGDIIKHNINFYLVMYNYKGQVMLKQKSGKSRDINWLGRVHWFCEIIANIQNDKRVWDKWQHLF